MKQTLHILHIEDSKDDSDLVEQLLVRNGLACQLTRVETRSQVFDALENHSYDLILSDCRLPHFSGMHALEIAHALKPEIPFVFVSGTIGEEAAIESLRNGATDYVLKDRLARLVPAVRRAVAEAEEHTLCRQMQQRLHEVSRLEAISTLSKGIAHDFNNILTIILGHASLLANEAHQPERVKQIAGTITEAGQRAAEVVQQLMAFARKSTGHVVSLDLNSWVEDTLPSLRLPSHVQLQFHPGENLPRILADTAQLERILLNLSANAVESMPRGGTLTFVTRWVAASCLPGGMTALDHQAFICLEVTDTGSGMDLGTREHVFEPFYTTKERGRGTGLGLPVVYGLMQAHNGHVEMESAPGAGTVVSLFFPVPESPAQTSSQKNLSLRGSETLLVVEDEEAVATFLETILEHHGYRILSAPDRARAVAIFKANADEIALVFSDVGLPKVDGITLCTELKALKPSQQIILASGYPPREFQARMDALGNQDFIPKPYQAHDILQRVRKVLDTAVAPKTA